MRLVVDHTAKPYLIYDIVTLMKNQLIYYYVFHEVQRIYSKITGQSVL